MPGSPPIAQPGRKVVKVPGFSLALLPSRVRSEGGGIARLIDHGLVDVQRLVSEVSNPSEKM